MADHIPNVLDPYSPPYASREQRADFADGLRELAAWVETTRFPIPQPTLRADIFGGTIIAYSTWIDDPGFVKRAGSAARLIGGRVIKATDYADNFTLTREFRAGVTFKYNISREAVCEVQEVTVHEEIEAAEDAETEAQLKERIQAIEAELDSLPKITRLMPVTRKQFTCPDSLLAKPVEQEAGQS